MDFDLGELKLYVQEDEVTFSLCTLMKPLDECRVLFVIEFVDKFVEGQWEKEV